MYQLKLINGTGEPSNNKQVLYRSEHYGMDKEYSYIL